MNATKLFKEAVAAIPKDVTTQVNWSFAIADKIDAKLKEIGMTQKEFAKKYVCEVFYYGRKRPFNKKDHQSTSPLQLWSL